MARKSKILGFVRQDQAGLGPVHYYRVSLPLTALGKYSKFLETEVVSTFQYQERLKLLGEELAAKTMLQNDVWCISRLYSVRHLDDFLKAVYGSGAITIFDTDDDLTDEFRRVGRGEDFIEVIKRFDHMTVSTPFLANRMQEHIGYRPTILPNHVDVDWFSAISGKMKRLIPGLTIGLVGTKSHEGDWIYPIEAMRRIAEEYPEVSLVVAGFMPSYIEQLPNAHKFDFVPYKNYPGIIRQFDIVCCSLDKDDMFNKSKSSIKALEAMAAARKWSSGVVGGAVPVCTDMAVYRRTVHHGHNGLLTSNDDWYYTLLQLVKDKELLYKLSRQGYEWVKRNRDIKQGWKLWERAYRSFL